MALLRFSFSYLGAQSHRSLFRPDQWLVGSSSSFPDFRSVALFMVMVIGSGRIYPESLLGKRVYLAVGFGRIKALLSRAGTLEMGYELDFKEGYSDTYWRGCQKYYSCSCYSYWSRLVSRMVTLSIGFAGFDGSWWSNSGWRSSKLPPFSC